MLLDIFCESLVADLLQTHTSAVKLGGAAADSDVESLKSKLGGAPISAAVQVHCCLSIIWAIQSSYVVNFPYHIIHPRLLNELLIQYRILFHGRAGVSASILPLFDFVTRI